MIEIKGSGPAFPWCGDLNETPFINLGMTLRDYFAAKAMEGMNSNPELMQVVTRGSILNGSALDRMAKNAYLQADAMLRAREA